MSFIFCLYTFVFYLALSVSPPSIRIPFGQRGRKAPLSFGHLPEGENIVVSIICLNVFNVSLSYFLCLLSFVFILLSFIWPPLCLPQRGRRALFYLFCLMPFVFILLSFILILGSWLYSQILNHILSPEPSVAEPGKKIAQQGRIGDGKGNENATADSIQDVIGSRSHRR